MPPGSVMITPRSEATLTPRESSLRTAESMSRTRSRKTPEPGSFAGRHASEPEDGALTLFDPTLYDGSKAKPIKLPNAPTPA